MGRYSFRDYDELAASAEALDGPTLAEWASLARSLDVVLVAGFAERGDGSAVFNSAAALDASGLRAVYRKAHLWNFEKTMFTAGDAPPAVVETAYAPVLSPVYFCNTLTRYGRIALMICYDIEFPEWVRAASLSGADLLCCPANWPLYPRPQGERPADIVRVQAAAATNRLFVALADRCGADRGQPWVGGSVVVGPDGYPLTTIALGAAGTHVAEVDLSEARDKKVSELNDVLADRRPALYAAVVRGNC